MMPFLFRFKTSCHSTSKKILNAEFSNEKDILLTSVGSVLIPAVNDKAKSLGTKKENLEKGEDESPSLMWK